MTSLKGRFWHYVLLQREVKQDKYVYLEPSNITLLLNAVACGPNLPQLKLVNNVFLRKNMLFFPLLSMNKSKSEIYLAMMCLLHNPP